MCTIGGNKSRNNSLYFYHYGCTYCMLDASARRLVHERLYAQSVLSTLHLSDTQRSNSYGIRDIPSSGSPRRTCTIAPRTKSPVFPVNVQ